jgi:signal transduction histidine kinase/CheY-like chemotaxis protein/HAMP domain-containing protein
VAVTKSLRTHAVSKSGVDVDPMKTLLAAMRAVGAGDFEVVLPGHWDGIAGKLAESFNEIVSQNRRLADGLARVGEQVGRKGRTRQRLPSGNRQGAWAGMERSVNGLIDDLISPVETIAQALTGVAKGDLTQSVPLDVDGRPLQGEFLRSASIVNRMLEQMTEFSSEVTRVAREVGTEGKLGGQAIVPGVAGTWKDLTDNVNNMASNLTGQVRNITEVATAIANGDLSKKITVDVRGEILLLKETLNTMVDQLRSFAAEVTRVAREVGTEGRLGGQAVVPGVDGTWKDLTDNVNLLAANLTTQVRNIAEVTTAVARGDLSRKITVDVKGEILELKNTINTMVDQLNGFASEVTRVAREVGTEGRLGGQATVPGVAGTWKDLTDTVNVMAANLTEQVRGIVKVVTAVAEGDLKQRLTVKSKGEVAALADTINGMTETLAIFADQVTTVAREVGVEGRLGGQADVPGAAGTWKDLTGNVNLLAENLTNQVRAIAEVATAVTEGDLTRNIQVEARGEVAELKDYINSMIVNLRLTTERNTEQDWLKTNLARFTGMLQGQRDLETVGRTILSTLVPLLRAQQGVIYQVSNATRAKPLRLLAAYGNPVESGFSEELALGAGLIGQCAVDKQHILLTDVPQDMIRIDAGLIKAIPRSVAVLPVTFEGEIKAVISISSLNELEPIHLTFLEQLTSNIGIVLNSIEATMRTESLLAQSQTLATELQSQQRELQQTNDQLEVKAQQLAEQNVEVERKNLEIDLARRAVEEKAAELALTSRYKSEFLANMSHELRTPLNSILILSQQLTENPDGNLTERQVEFARTVLSAGTDLLNLISDILDLSKIESGTVTVEAEDISLHGLLETVARPFRHEAERRQLAFHVELDQALGKTINTDSKRLQQILKNLLSNAFKFTSEGGVRISVLLANGGSLGERSASLYPQIAFEVADSGIGIPLDKQRLIFEAFQQADASTSRKYGGTGLGLAISRELANLLGGEIQLRSEPGAGSTFTLFLPGQYVGPMGLEAAGYSRVISAEAIEDADKAAEAPAAIGDDRDDIGPGDEVILIVDDDPAFVQLLMEIAREKLFKVLVASRGSDALALAYDYNPTAIFLGAFLPDMMGWSVLGELKRNQLTRHIPVQIVTLDEDQNYSLSRGAFGHVVKPSSIEELGGVFDRLQAFARGDRRPLLIVEGSKGDRPVLTELLAHDDVDMLTAKTGQMALDYLRNEPVRCVIVDLELADMTGFELIEQMKQSEELSQVPVIVFTGRALTADDESRLRHLARSIVVKSVESAERLLDEAALFLHLNIANLEADKQELLGRLHRSDEDIIGKTVLVVDDDARNIFALSSVLERRGMTVLTAATGHEAVEALDGSDVSIVLMDIMMPEMDGYQTIREIRSREHHQRLPIIALTARAMKGDREKCLEAGASDYLAKPVDTDQLLAALRIWLHR